MPFERSWEEFPPCALTGCASADLALVFSEQQIFDWQQPWQPCDAEGVPLSMPHLAVAVTEASGKSARQATRASKSRRVAGVCAPFFSRLSIRSFKYAIFQRLQICRGL
jgi:hypothetical protein